MLLESIQIQDGELQRLALHQERIARSMRSIYNGDNEIDFAPMIAAAKKLGKGRHKLRVEYNHTFLKYTIQPYTLPTIESLQLVHCSKFKYAFKFSDRTQLDHLYEQRREADDILIINSGMVTDTWFCNVAFLRDGNWETPYLPLLHGTQRAALLGKGTIKEAMITESDLPRYERVRLFNAMIEFGEVELGTGNVWT